MRGTPAFSIDLRRTGASDHLAVAGELDIATSDQLVEGVRAVQEAGGKFAVIDLGEVRFMDSQGLRALVAVKRMSDADGFDMAIVRAPAPVRDLAELTGADRLLPFVDDAGPFLWPRTN